MRCGSSLSSRKGPRRGWCSGITWLWVGVVVLGCQLIILPRQRGLFRCARADGIADCYLLCRMTLGLRTTIDIYKYQQIDVQLPVLFPFRKTPGAFFRYPCAKSCRWLMSLALSFVEVAGLLSVLGPCSLVQPTIAKGKVRLAGSAGYW